MFRETIRKEMQHKELWQIDLVQEKQNITSLPVRRNNTTSIYIEKTLNFLKTLKTLKFVSHMTTQSVVSKNLELHGILHLFWSVGLSKRFCRVEMCENNSHCLYRDSLIYTENRTTNKTQIIVKSINMGICNNSQNI